MNSYRFSTLAGFLSSLSLLFVGLPTQAASFDCGKASTKVERLICDNGILSRNDDTMNGVYQYLLGHTNDKAKFKASQRHWLKTVRNKCDDFDCLQRVYGQRNGILLTMVMAYKSSHTASSPTTQPSRSYHFTLTKGKGVAVCEAYLQRLNTADYSTPPYCNIPEDTQVPGFTPLHRVPLTAKEIAVFALHVSSFNDIGRQLSKKDIAKQMARSQMTPEILLQNIQKQLQSGGTKVWRYDPPVDMNNDGKPDNVMVWHTGGCGHPVQTSNYETDGRTPTLAYVLTADNTQLDVSKTKAIFGDPSGGYPIRDNSIYPGFRPLGPTIGIFKYQQRYYIETYLYDYPVNSWGWVSDSTEYNPKLANTLAVFLRQHGKTRRMCEYHMTETE